MLITKTSILCGWLMGLVALAGEASAQTLSPGATENPAQWWTLTDDILPEQLRAIHEDVRLHQQRFLEAVEAGKEEPISDEKLARLRFYANGAMTPELSPMWAVYKTFALGFHLEDDDPIQRLVDFGFEGEALETIVAFSSQFANERKVLVEKSQQEQDAVIEMVRLAEKRMGTKSYGLATRTKDVGMFASATGYSEERVKELLRIWNRTPPGEEFTFAILPKLKAVLSDADWDRFRLFLLQVYAPMRYGVAFNEEGD